MISKNSRHASHVLYTSDNEHCTQWRQDWASVFDNMCIHSSGVNSSLYGFGARCFPRIVLHTTPMNCKRQTFSIAHIVAAALSGGFWQEVSVYLKIDSDIKCGWAQVAIMFTLKCELSALPTSLYRYNAIKTCKISHSQDPMILILMQGSEKMKLVGFYKYM